MFSFVLRGKLGEIFAPRLDPKDELHALIKAGLFDKAMEELEAPGRHDNVNELDTNGISVLHVACAAGATEIVVELLSRGADINLISSNGSSPLHYATMNNRKRIVEILLRSGADPSLPNSTGLIPVELSTSQEVIDVLLRERPNFHSGRQIEMCSPETPDEDTINKKETRNPTIMEHEPDVQLAMDQLSLAANPTTSIHILPEPTIGLHRTRPMSPIPSSIYEAVLRAAIETADSYKAPPDETDRRREFFKSCQQIDKPERETKMMLNRLCTLLSEYPELAHVRAANQGNMASDGATALHCAAQWDNVEALKVLLSRSSLSPWTVDLQGRTPLHIAAEWNKEGSARILREAMSREKAVDPIGEYAPGDLTGTTPLGWATKRSKGRPSAAIQEALFSPGDHSILPRTPHTARARGMRGHGVGTGAGTTMLSYAFSEAAGWRGSMEDRVLARSPMPGVVEWSLFGVFDGHGGAYCSTFLASEFPAVLLQEIIDVPLILESEDCDGGSSPCPRGNVELVLRRAVMAVDLKLKEDPRMKVVVVDGDDGQGKKKFITQDHSGSTAVICLLSARLLVVANVGDSRAVLGQVNAVGDTTNHKIINSSIIAVALTQDHKLSMIEERTRAQKAGGIVEEFGGDGLSQLTSWQVSTESHSTRLRMSRSIGDFYLKQRHDLSAEQQIVTAAPDIVVHERCDSDVMVLMASDGVFDVMSNQEAIEFVANQLETHTTGGVCGVREAGEVELAAACDALLTECLRRGSQDNMSALVVLLSPPPPAQALIPVSVSQTPGHPIYSPPSCHSGDVNGSGVSFASPGPTVENETISPIKARHLLFSV